MRCLCKNNRLLCILRWRGRNPSLFTDGFAYGNIDKGDLVTITETTYLYGLLTDKSLATD